MSRATLTFRLARAEIRQALIDEFSLHEGVEIVAGDPDERTLHIQTHNSPVALWDVRATVGMFDDDAVEIGPDQ